MKKSLMILASVALGASLAAATDVTSRNVVGFNTVSVATPGYTLMAGNWQGMDGNPVSLQNYFEKTDLYAGAGPGEFDCDQVDFFDTDIQNYVSYYFWDVGDGGKWYDFDGNEADVQLVYGLGFWFSRFTGNGSNELTIKGQVPTNSSFSFSAPVGYSLYGSAYPVEITFGAGIIGYPGSGPGEFDCDQIDYFDSSIQNYVSYYFWDVGDGGQWYDFDGNPVTSTIPLGSGAWYSNYGQSQVNWVQESVIQ